MPTFDFEGERLSYSAMREVDYQNQDLEVGIYYNSTGFAAGAYTVQLFCDGRLIGTSQSQCDKQEHPAPKAGGEPKPRS